jgi:kynurenine formamidase
MRYSYLSYPLSSATPIYAGGKRPLISKIRGTGQNGKGVNVFQLSFNNHSGTHIDSPNHFFAKGKAIAEYPAEFWKFNSPVIIDVTLRPSGLLKCGKWVKEISRGNDVVLFKSGWGRFRQEKKYIYENPGLHPEAAYYLRRHFPGLRALGIDWISVSSFQQREVGKKTHKILLDYKKTKPILIIEDMFLPAGLRNLEELIVLPLLVDGIDSSLCTIIGKQND